MGSIYGIQFKYWRKSAVNLFFIIRAYATACTYSPLGGFGILWRYPPDSVKKRSPIPTLTMRSSKEFLFLLLNSFFLYFCRISFGRIWAHGKYSYGICRRFANILGNFQKITNIEKCQHFFQRLDFAPNNIKDFFYQPKLRPVDVNTKWPVNFNRRLPVIPLQQCCAEYT